jgi:hypothetical protein
LVEELMKPGQLSLKVAG